MRQRLIPIASVTVTAAFAAWLSWPQQEGDAEFDARVAQPAYREAGPRVWFDEGHWYVHTADGRYKPFADLVRNDGYVVVPSKEHLTSGALKTTRFS